MEILRNKLKRTSKVVSNESIVSTEQVIEEKGEQVANLKKEILESIGKNKKETRILAEQKRKEIQEKRVLKNLEERHNLILKDTREKEEEISKIKNEIDNQELEIEMKKFSIEEAQADLNYGLESLKKLKKEFEKHNLSLGDIEIEISKKKNDSFVNQLEIDRLDRDIKKCQEDLELKRSEILNLDSELSDKKNRMIQSKDQYYQLRQKLNVFQMDLKKQREEIYDFGREERELQSRIKIMRDLIDTKNKEIHKNRKIIDQMKSKRASNEKRLIYLELIKDRKEGELIDQGQKIKDIQLSQDELNNQKNDLLTIIHDKPAESLGTVSNEKGDFQSFNHALSLKLLKNSKNGQLNIKDLCLTSNENLNFFEKIVDALLKPVSDYLRNEFEVNIKAEDRVRWLEGTLQFQLTNEANENTIKDFITRMASPLVKELNDHGLEVKLSIPKGKESINSFGIWFKFNTMNSKLPKPLAS